MKIKISYYIIIYFATAFSGCKNRPIYDISWRTAQVPINIDWSAANLDPDNDPKQDVYSASVWLFPKDARKKVIEYRLTNPRGGVIDVPVGEYDMIVINNTIREYSNINFEGMGRFETFCAKAAPETENQYISKGSDELFIKSPEVLAAWSFRNLIITQQMVVLSKSNTKAISDMLPQLAKITPQRLVYMLNLTVHVKELSSAKSATGIIRGMASGCYLASGQTIPPRAWHAFVLNSRKYYEGQTSHGTVETRIMTFGRLKEAPTDSYTLQTDFILRDNTTFGPTLHNITERVVNSTPQGGELKIDLKVGIDGDTEITLPKMPDAGLDVGLGDWEDEEDIPLEI